MKVKVILFSVLVAATVTVIACEMVANLRTIPVKVGPFSTIEQKYNKIANKLDAFYRGVMKPLDIITVEVPVTTCLGGVCGETIVKYYKPCEQSLGEALKAIDTSLGGTGLDPNPTNPTFPGQGMPLIGCHTEFYRSCGYQGGQFLGCETWSRLVCPIA